MITNAPLSYSSDSEVVPADEEIHAQRAVAALRKLLKLSHDASGEFRRGVHVKSHGCAVASLQVMPGLPAELSQGVFAVPKTYEAVVRFSNAAFFPQADALPDGRGMAIKVRGVTGDVLERDDDEAAQDFVMVNHPAFFAADVKDFARLEEALVESWDSRFNALKDALTAGESNPLNWHWKEVFRVAEMTAQVPRHPARYTYYSMSPIRYGEYVAKYRALPVGELQAPLLEVIGTLAGERDAFRLLLQESLREQALLFEFQVQLQTSRERMPVEDATVIWPEDQSPFQTVGLLVLPRQSLDVPDEQADRERLSFSVWHALAAHQPLGGINRLRREIYPISVRWRR